MFSRESHAWHLVDSRQAGLQPRKGKDLLGASCGEGRRWRGYSIYSLLSLKYSFWNVLCLGFLRTSCCFPEFIFLRKPHGSLLVASFHFIVFSPQGSLTVATLNSLKFPSTPYTISRTSPNTLSFFLPLRTGTFMTGSSVEGGCDEEMKGMFSVNIAYSWRSTINRSSSLGMPGKV